MENRISRIFMFDGDICEVTYQYDPELEKFLGDYPDFAETPRYTPLGRPWTSAMQDGCEYGENKFCRFTPCDDCGSCQYFLQEKPHDLIGICAHEAKRRVPTTEAESVDSKA